MMDVIGMAVAKIDESAVLLAVNFLGFFFFRSFCSSYKREK